MNRRLIEKTTYLVATCYIIEGVHVIRNQAKQNTVYPDHN